MNDVRTRTVVCCFRGRVRTDLSVFVGGVLICFCFHVVADLSFHDSSIQQYGYVHHTLFYRTYCIFRRLYIIQQL